MKTPQTPQTPPYPQTMPSLRPIPAILPPLLLSSGNANAPGMIKLNAPDVANSVLLILANVLEASPGTETNSGIRKLAAAAGKELGQLVREARQLKLAGQAEPGTLQ